MNASHFRRSFCRVRKVSLLRVTVSPGFPSVVGVRFNKNSKIRVYRPRNVVRSDTGAEVPCNVFFGDDTEDSQTTECNDPTRELRTATTTVSVYRWFSCAAWTLSRVKGMGGGGVSWNAGKRDGYLQNFSDEYFIHQSADSVMRKRSVDRNRDERRGSRPRRCVWFALAKTETAQSAAGPRAFRLSIRNPIRRHASHGFS